MIHSFNITRRVLTLAAFTTTCCMLSVQAHAQLVNQAVGGIAVDAEGVVAAPSEFDDAKLAELRATALAAVPEDLEAFTDLRCVSLKQLEAQVAEHLAAGKEVPEAVRYLAGLQRVQYVFVYPEEHDVVLAGPAEGWRLDRLGNVVGATTGRPVLLLEDLVVALRTRNVEQLEPVSCSIDPTAEGIQRVRAVLSRMREMGNPDETLATVEDALGRQQITVTGVPTTSHFARAMVAADFRMKRLAMGFDAPPVGNLPSFMELISHSRGTSNTMPRWWLAPLYEPLARDVEGLAWEVRGQGVQCLTEEDYFNAEGKREKSAKAGALATKWAQNMTNQFAELATHDSSFAALRNAMDLAVVAALIDKEGLLLKAELALPELTHGFQLSQYDAPRQVASQATFVRRRKDFVISASGGVQILPWEIVDQVAEVTDLGKVRTQVAVPNENWWR